MLELTKRQFLKKSAKCMDETGGLLLLLKEIIDNESQGKISNSEASKKLDIIRKEIEVIFYEFEKLNSPSRCSSLKQKVLNILISMQEIVVINSESLYAAKEGLNGQSQNKLSESRARLEKFRKDFHDVTKRVNVLLTEKKSSKT
ncbi:MULTISPECIES: hypothetical protein [Methanobacterium]|uniref:Uncharacterized protein n=1 Tax=Methanobacterium bryantii TaxID=2161 RepID=A0A2A2H522_METBR|nr:MULTISPECIES: hypothetical protein [Methanobacterium]OEC88288.1 hypothetical protein A9507_05055 [Methanobacterium sp. A39]PAV04477.1 hypothetical protein ASJ80_06470 [Methanobacterium bryantii]